MWACINMDFCFITGGDQPTHTVSVVITVILCLIIIITGFVLKRGINNNMMCGHKSGII